MRRRSNRVSAAGHIVCVYGHGHRHHCQRCFQAVNFVKAGSDAVSAAAVVQRDNCLNAVRAFDFRISNKIVGEIFAFVLGRTAVRSVATH